MLFLGLGTGLGSALISGKVIVPLEIGLLTFDGEHTLEEVLARRGLARLGLARWRAAVEQVVKLLRVAFIADYIVIRGGNAHKLSGLAPGLPRRAKEQAPA